MKKIFTLATVVLLFSGAAFACDGKGKGKCCKGKKECKKSDEKVAKKETTATKKA